MNVADVYGNAVGGWRFLQIDFPTRIYVPFRMSMKQEYKLEAESAEKCVEKGLLLKEDMEECIQHAVKKASEDGLV